MAKKYKKIQFGTFTIGNASDSAETRTRLEELINEYGWEIADWKVIGREPEGVNIAVMLTREDTVKVVDVEEVPAEQEA